MMPAAFMTDSQLAATLTGLSDVALFDLTYSTNPAIARIAGQIAHARAEAYARSHTA